MSTMSEIKQIDSFLKSKSKNPKVTNWEFLHLSWISNNPRSDLSIKMPDYLNQ